jgi:hypothetical protein
LNQLSLEEGFDAGVGAAGVLDAAVPESLVLLASFVSAGFDSEVASEVDSEPFEA